MTQYSAQEIAAAYQELDMEPGGGLEEVESHYRFLVKAMHPSRHADSSKEMAEQKMTRVNRALVVLKEHLAAVSEAVAAADAIAASEESKTASTASQMAESVVGTTQQEHASVQVGTPAPLLPVEAAQVHLGTEPEGNSAARKAGTNRIVISLMTVILLLIGALFAALLWPKADQNPIGGEATAQKNDAETAESAASPLSEEQAQEGNLPAGHPSVNGSGGGDTSSGANETPADTLVPSGKTPQQFLVAYHEAVQDERWAAAYEMLPKDKQQAYGDAATYGEQLAAYGITGYKLGKPVTTGDSMSIAGEQITPQMPITYTWTFQKVDGEWYCVSREMGGTVE